MAATSDESRILIPSLPTLLHLASVKIALPLLKEFYIKQWKNVFEVIQLEEAETSEEDTKENRIWNSTKDNLLFIPAHLRECVIKAVGGLEHELKTWTFQHYSFSDSVSPKRVVHWRSDGSIDNIKSAHQLVQNENISIKNRFRLACLYCLENTVKALWAQMEESSETENLDTIDDSIVRFWIKRLRERSLVPWKQAAREYLDRPNIISSISYPPLMSVYLPLLRPEDRQEYLSKLDFFSFDDLRVCLYMVTKSEEEQIVKSRVSTLLLRYLNWPLQNLFLAAVEKMWDYIDEYDYDNLLQALLSKEDDFEYAEIFEGLWERSPMYLREEARKNAFLRKRIDDDDKKDTMIGMKMRIAMDKLN